MIATWRNLLADWLWDRIASASYRQVVKTYIRVGLREMAADAGSGRVTVDMLARAMRAQHGDDWLTNGSVGHWADVQRTLRAALEDEGPWLDVPSAWLSRDEAHDA